ncbi:MAG: hypothetical protein EZS26_002673 [Candidatus Ordinivivax streblomastigis]|uniref:Uncharacterized protein n=1 Tax=Candidatus Ordinivivax streblomastigis TaxID=2540710 RepID=A0A5M8NWD0_9BACT|nr:MAG: hypothetical protein EZS26_002673 [Candidatus Ordinivivax streblomastigis]
MEQVTNLPHHIWVSSGYTTVSPVYHTVMGVGEFFSPPFAARRFNLKVDVTADGTTLIDDGSVYGRNFRYAGGTWLPHKIIRNGTCHRFLNGKLVSLSVVSELIPLLGQVGFLEKITYTNRATTPVQLKISPALTPGNPVFMPLNRWGYGVPDGKTAQAQVSGEDRWNNEVANIGIYTENESATLAPGQKLETVITVVMVKKDEQLPEKTDTGELIRRSTGAWQKRLDTYTKNIPSLTSNIDGLDDYYKRSVLSGLVCIWENPEYIVNPFVSTAGIDGGAICAYLWDTGGYMSNMMSLMFDIKVIEIAKRLVAIDLDRFYAFTPDGSGVGVRYSYSTVAFTRLVDAIFKFYGANDGLFDYAKKMILSDEKRKLPNELIDYGTQGNLLEMQGAGWEHIVASPNAERSWCLKSLTEMGKYAGATPTEISEWKQQSARIVEAIRKVLWSEEKQWFASLYPDGFRDYVHTIQVFDVMGAGVCTPEMERALTAELNDRSYLGSCGMAAVSKSDSVHYEVIDTDWGGGGAYVGDTPQTALIMYDRGYPQTGWDILRRHFWMGKHCLYYPQEHYCDRPMAPPHTRANEVTGLCGAEAVLFGLIGFQPQYDGTLFINPQVTVEGNISLKGFVYHQHTFDVEVSASKIMVNRNGKTIYKGKPKRIKIL